MLVLTLKEGETVGVGEITVTACRCSDGRVRLGFDGPRDIQIQRANAKVKLPATVSHFAGQPIPAMHAGDLAHVTEFCE